MTRNPKYRPVFFATLGAAIVYFLVILSQSSRWSSSPTTTRIDHKRFYERQLDPAEISSISTLEDAPFPEYSLRYLPTDDGDSPEPEVLALEADPQGGHLFFSPNIFEVFNADDRGQLKLPDDTELSLKAIAVVLPPSQETEDPSADPEQVPLNWIDPYTGDPAKEPEDLPKQTRAPAGGPRLLFCITHSAPYPIRWHHPLVFDSRTHAEVSASSFYSTRQDFGLFFVDLEIWHQAPLELLVPVSFGQPTEKELPLEAGASASFGTDAEIRLLEIVPNGLNEVRTIQNSAGNFDYHFSLNRDQSTPGPPSMIVQLWPRENEHLMELLPRSNNLHRRLDGQYGVSPIRLTARELRQNKSVVRRFPNAGRVIFPIPTIPLLPETDNLFQAPISSITFDSSLSYLKKIAKTVEAELDLSRDFNGDSLPLLETPRTHTDTTPAELLEYVEETTGLIFYYDDSGHFLTDQEPPSPLTQFLNSLRK